MQAQGESLADTQTGDVGEVEKRMVASCGGIADRDEAVGSSGVLCVLPTTLPRRNEDAIEPASAQQGLAHLGIVEVVEVAIERGDCERVTILGRETPEEVRGS